MIAAIWTLVVAPLLVGRLFGAARAEGVRGRPEEGLPWPAQLQLGLLAMGALLFFCHALRMPESLAFALPSAVALGSAAWWVVAQRQTTTTPHGSVLGGLAPLACLVVLLLPVVVAAVAYTFVVPVHSWDALMVWFMKVRGLERWPSLADMPWPTYPELGPLLWRSVVRSDVPIDEAFGRLVTSCAFVAGGASLAYGVGDDDRAASIESHRLRAPVAVAAALCVVALFDRHLVTSGYQDPIVLGVGATVSVLLLRTRFRVRPDGGAPRPVWAAAFGCGALVLVKNEGVVLGGILWVAYVVVVLARLDATLRPVRLRALLVPSGIAAAIVVAATAARGAAGVDVTDVQHGDFGGVGFETLLHRVERVPVVLQAIVTRLLAQPVVVATPLVVGLALVRVRRAVAVPLAFCALVAGLHLSALVAVFVATNAPLDWHLQTALDRLLFQGAFSFCLAVCVATHALARGASPSKDQ